MHNVRIAWPIEAKALGVTLSSIAAGVLAFLLSAGWFVVVLAITLREQAPFVPRGAGSGRGPIVVNAVTSGMQSNSAQTLAYPLIPVVLGPIVETLLFLWVYKALEKLGGRAFSLMPFIIVMVLLSWALHGATRLDFGPALGFAVLAFVYFRCAKRNGLLWAYFAAALAHIVWNSIPLAIFLSRR